MKLSLSGNLWHHRDFARLWFSETVSSFGSQFSGLAIPFLAILSFGATSFEYGALLALGILPYPVLGLFVGVWADRFRKRRIMTLCNLGRMATLASIPVAWALGELSLAQLFLVTLTNGIFSVFFDISYQAYLPILVERADLIEGNQKLQVSASGASVAGPAVTGFVYQLIGGALTCAVDAVGYFVAFLALLDIRKVEPKKDIVSRDFFGEMREGIRVVSGNPLLWTIAGSTATSQPRRIHGRIGLQYLHVEKHPLFRWRARVGLHHRRSRLRGGRARRQKVHRPRWASGRASRSR